MHPDTVEQAKQVSVAQAYAAMGQRYAHGFRIRGAVQVDKAAEGVDRAQAIDARFAAA